MDEQCMKAAAGKMREAMRTCTAKTTKRSGSKPAVVTLTMPEGTFNLIDYLLKQIEDGQVAPARQ